jgi:SAM-dependent methyltransferase
LEFRIQNEIEHGKYLAEKGPGLIWNWESPAGKLRWERRVKMLTKYINPDDNVLEIGCGTGYFSKELTKTNASITSIDISPNLLEIAKKEVIDKNIKFKIENAYSLSFSDESFDIIVGSSVLHHLDIDKALSEFYRVVKKGKTICFTEPNMLNPQIALQKNIPSLKKYLGDSPDETAFFRWSLVKKLKKVGFHNIKIVPFDFLHPSFPKYILGFMKPLCEFAEKIPLFTEIAGSLYILAEK